MLEYTPLNIIYFNHKFRILELNLIYCRQNKNLANTIQFNFLKFNIHYIYTLKNIYLWSNLYRVIINFNTQIFIRYTTLINFLKYFYLINFQQFLFQLRCQLCNLKKLFMISSKFQKEKLNFIVKYIYHPRKRHNFIWKVKIQNLKKIFFYQEFIYKVIPLSM